MQPPVEPVGAKTCSTELSSLSLLLPKGLMFGGAPDDGDCFFDAVFQVFRALGIPNLGRCADLRLTVKAFWDGKSEVEAEDDYAALLHDSTIQLPTCVTNLHGFKNWVIQTPEYIANKVLLQQGLAGFGEFPSYPYWGGILDFQVT